MWAIAWPFLLAAWLVLFVILISCYFGRTDAGTDVGTNRIRWRPARRGIGCVFYLAVGFGGLILVVALPSWSHWVQLQVRGVAVRAKVVNWSQ